ncbi:unnamed protein product [Cuscuta campestris]|uniref:Protein FAR1-RELATED SEQUENCE n=1 Tax=Cuscuta campestris TaxID=132261 RepID=A0A484N3I1_9ASTE|nr:unnamed protein product [Cuscuta campestris]
MEPTVGNDKKKDLETYFGCKGPDRVEIHPPTIGVTKGRKRRIKSGVKKGQEKQKPTRRCGSCNKMTTHDIRNCPLKNNRMALERLVFRSVTTWGITQLRRFLSPRE